MDEEEQIHSTLARQGLYAANAIIELDAKEVLLGCLHSGEHYWSTKTGIPLLLSPMRQHQRMTISTSCMDWQDSQIGLLTSLQKEQNLTTYSRRLYWVNHM